MSWLFSHLINKELLSKDSASAILSVLGADEPVVPDHVAQTGLFEKEGVLSLTGGVGPAEFDAGTYYGWIKQCRLLLRELEIGSGEQAVIINGRVGNIYILGHSMTDGRVDCGSDRRRRV